MAAKVAIRAAVMDMGLDGVDVDPDVVALQLLSYARDRVNLYAGEFARMVAEHGLQGATVGTSVVVDFEGGEHEVGEYVRGLAGWELQWAKFAGDLAFKAKAANLGERHLELAAETRDQMVEVLGAVRAHPLLGLSAAQREVFGAVVREVLGLGAGPLTIEGSAG